MNTLGVLTFIFTLALLIVVHEFGHYITAKKFGMKVEEYFIGFGPRIWSTRRGETEYGIKAIPLGGYVKIAGMNPWQTVPDDDAPRTFGAKPAWQRAIVLVAGSMNHFILAFLVFTIMYGAVGIQDFDKPLTVVDSVDVLVNNSTGPAKAAGLRSGDKIVEIDGQPVNNWDQVRNEIRTSGGSPLQMTVVRDGERKTITVTPAFSEVRTDANDPSKTERVGQIGILPEFARVRESPPEAIWLGLKTTGVAIWQSTVAIPKIFSPNSLGEVFASVAGEGRRGAEQPFGLVGGARLAGEVASSGQFQNLVLFLLAFVIFVGVINLVPLPPLDGGHLLVVLIEKLSGRKVDMRKVVPVATLVVGFLLVLTVTLLYLDIARPVTNPFQ